MDYYYTSSRGILCSLWRGKPAARANISGGDSAPELNGSVEFYVINEGVIVLWNIYGLPDDALPCRYPVYAFHVHSGNVCDSENDFAGAGSHYNPDDCAHPFHAGDLPPLFANGGHSFGLVLTDRFAINDILGKAAVIHAGVDDFTSQPAGNAGERIGCGIIERVL